MKERIKQIFKDYTVRSYIFAGFSFVINIAFLVYNFVVGLLYDSIWNSTISGYYLLLIIMRLIVLICEERWKNKGEEEKHKKRVSLFRSIGILLVVLDVSVNGLVLLMLADDRPVNVSKIAAIAIAAYTTYKIIIAIYNFSKTRRQENLSLFSLKIISLMDALVSLITLQNTLIITFGNFEEMGTMMFWTSFAITMIMAVLTIFLLWYGHKMAKEEKNENAAE